MCCDLQNDVKQGISKTDHVQQRALNTAGVHR
jgi:hypothetical protein